MRCAWLRQAHPWSMSVARSAYRRQRITPGPGRRNAVTWPSPSQTTEGRELGVAHPFTVLLGVRGGIALLLRYKASLQLTKKRDSMIQLDFELQAEIDEDGFVALVSPDAYSGFIGEDWTLDQLIPCFLKNLNTGALFVAHLGPDLANEPLRISSTRSPIPALREFSSLIQVGQAGVQVTDYTQLTMSAQFADEPPITRSHLTLPIPAGVYQVTLRQFAQSYEDGVDPVAELIVEPAAATKVVQSFESIPWAESILNRPGF